MWFLNLSRFQVLLSTVFFRTRGRSVKEEWVELAKTPSLAFGMMMAGSHFGTVLGSLIGAVGAIVIARSGTSAPVVILLQYTVVCVPFLCGVATEIETRMRREQWERPERRFAFREGPVYEANLVANRWLLMPSSITGILVGTFAGYVFMVFDPLEQIR